MEVSAEATRAEVILFLPEWSEVRVALDDILDAYNGVPVKPSQCRANIIALWCLSKQQRVFVPQDRLGFGLASALPTFCRASRLTVAGARQTLGSMAGA